MYYPLPSFSALTAIAFSLSLHCALTSAGHARFHGNQVGTHQRLHQRNHLLHPRQSSHPGDDLVKRQSDIQRLQTEATAFAQWMTAWFASTNATNSAASIGQVKDEVHAHQVVLQTWLNAPSTTASITPSNLQQLRLEVDAFNGWTTVWIASANATDAASAVALLKQEVEAYKGWLNAWIAAAASGVTVSVPAVLMPPVAPPSTAGAATTTSFVTVRSTSTATRIAVVTATSSLIVSPVPAVAAPPTSSLAVSSSIPAADATPAPVSVAAEKVATPAGSSAPPGAVFAPVRSSTASPSPAPSAAKSPSVPASRSGFNAQASDNVAVYFGQTDQTGNVGLDRICADDSVDIVVLAFLTLISGGGGYPGLNFGAACGGQTDAMKAAGATDLLDCPLMKTHIQTCQSKGKIVLLSIGGAVASSTFAGDGEAAKFAQQLWDLFGAGTGLDKGMRPFGDVVLDGFDFDNESHNPTGYATLASTLRTLMNTSSSKPFYLSSAPQCPIPDASIPIDALTAMDFVFVQFYNNGDCNLGAPGFAASFQKWSEALQTGRRPRLFVAAMADVKDGTGFVDAGRLMGEVGKVKGVGVNLGGVALWDGSQAIANGGFERVVKEGLRG